MTNEHPDYGSRIWVLVGEPTGDPDKFLLAHAHVAYLLAERPDLFSILCECAHKRDDLPTQLARYLEAQ